MPHCCGNQWDFNFATTIFCDVRKSSATPPEFSGNTPSLTLAPPCGAKHVEQMICLAIYLSTQYVRYPIRSVSAEPAVGRLRHSVPFARRASWDRLPDSLLVRAALCVRRTTESLEKVIPASLPANAVQSHLQQQRNSPPPSK